MDDLDGEHLNDIIRNALSMALNQQDGSAPEPAAETAAEPQAPDLSQVHDSHQETHDEHDHDQEIAQALAAAAAVEQEQQDQDAARQNTAEEDDEEAANRHLLQQLQAVMNQENMDAGDQHMNHYDGHGNEHDIDPTLTGSHDHHFDDSRPETQAQAEAPPKKQLSIAETLALSRNRMKTARSSSNASNIHDPMVQRYGLHRSSLGSHNIGQHSTRPETSSRMMIMASRMGAGGPAAAAVAAAVKKTVYNKPRPRSVSNNTSENDHNNQVMDTSENNDHNMTDNMSAAASETDLDNNILRTLIMAKEAAEAEQEADGDLNKDDMYSNETMDAVQAVLQALSRSYEDESSENANEAADSVQNASVDPALEGGQTATTAAKRRKRDSKPLKPRKHLSLLSDELSPEEKERIRQENRLRKKKWRDFNAERNKDNDLRARLHRRAARMFGPGDSVEKAAWIAEEFEKRRLRRLERGGQLKNNHNGNSGNSRAARSLAKDLSAKRQLNSSEGAEMDFNAAVDALSRSNTLDLGEAVNTLVKDPSILRSMIDLLADDSANNGANNGANGANAGANTGSNANLGDSEHQHDNENVANENVDSENSVDVNLGTSDVPDPSSHALEAQNSHSNSASANRDAPLHSALPSLRPPPFRVGDNANSTASKPSPEAASTKPHTDQDKTQNQDKVRSLGFPPMLGLQSSQKASQRT